MQVFENLVFHLGAGPSLEMRLFAERDLMAMLEEIAPWGADYEHHKTGEDNGDAHLKNILVGHQVVLPITKGELDLGPWQQVFYAEFDGQRRKRVIVKIIGE